MAPDAGSLLHGYVTAISKSAEKRLETIKQLAIGACGLRVWKVAQLVEQWIFNLCVPGSIPGFLNPLYGKSNTFYLWPVEIQAIFMYDKKKKVLEINMKMKIGNKELLLYSANKAINSVSVAASRCADKEEVYFTIGTAVHWLTDCTDRIPEKLLHPEHRRIFSAFRFVNNCLKHNVIFEEAHESEGLDFPFDFNFDMGATYKWKFMDDIEIPDKNKRQKENYDTCLRGKRVYATLSETMEIIKKYYSIL